MLDQIDASLRRIPFLPFANTDRSSQTSEISIEPYDVVEIALNRLKQSGYDELKNVTCDSYDGMLVLRGCVSSYYLKQMAQVIVRRISSVQSVCNAIDVTHSC